MQTSNLKPQTAIVFLGICIFSNNSLANIYSPPTNCIEGRTISDLKVEAPDYFAIDMPSTVKGDFPFVWNDNTKSVTFYNSVEGFVGHDNTDTWDNSYMDMAFPAWAEGPVVIWAQDSTNPLNQSCSKTNAVVQSLPVVSNIYVSGGASIQISILAQMSSFSKRNAQNQPLPLITYRFKNVDYNELDTLTTTNQSLSFTPTYTGFYQVEAIVNDGVFSTKTILGYVDFTGGTVPDDGFGNDVPIN